MVTQRMDEVHPLRKFRAKRKLTMADFAEIMGVTSATISRWETGERVPESKYWAKLKQVTGGKITADHFTPQAAE